MKGNTKEVCKMRGYKAFEKGLICRGKQYKENTVFEEPEARICHSGMHFCKEPLDVMGYYPLVDDNGNISDFAEVEARLLAMKERLAHILCFCGKLRKNKVFLLPFSLLVAERKPLINFVFHFGFFLFCKYLIAKSLFFSFDTQGEFLRLAV